MPSRSLPHGQRGGTEDPIYVMRAEDLVLWETGIKTRVLPETLGNTLTVKLQTV